MLAKGRLELARLDTLRHNLTNTAGAAKGRARLIFLWRVTGPVPSTPLSSRSTLKTSYFTAGA
jgi:hypothetical protein